MDAEELAKYRREYMDELVRFCKGFSMGPYPTHDEFEYLLSQISDDEIIDNVQRGIPPVRTIERLMYYETMCPLPKQKG